MRVVKLEQISQRCCGISILEDIQNRTDRTGPAESALSWPLFSARVGPDSLQRYLPTSAPPWFHGTSAT